MRYTKPQILASVPANRAIMGVNKGMDHADNAGSHPHNATASAYEADE
jgi:hypothetical protein